LDPLLTRLFTFALYTHHYEYPENVNIVLWEVVTMGSLKNKIIGLVTSFMLIALVMVVILAIPQTRAAVMEKAPSSVAGMLHEGEMSLIVENLVGSLDAEDLAAVVNDDESRAALLELIQETLPAMEADKVAELINELLADPETVDFCTRLMPLLDSQALAQLLSALVSDPIFGEFVSETIYSLDFTAVGRLTNDILTVQDEEGNYKMVTVLTGLVEELDVNDMTLMINELLSNESVSQMMTDFLGNLDSVAASDLANAVFADDASLETITDMLKGFDEEGMADFLLNLSSEVLANTLNALLADEDMAPGINDVIDELNAGAVADFLMALDEEKLAPFLNELLADDALGTWVGQLLPNLDTQHLAGLLNQLVTDEYHELSTWIADLLADLGTADLANFMTFVTQEQALIDWIEALFNDLDAEVMANMMGPIVVDGFVKPILIENSAIQPQLDALLGELTNGEVGKLLNTLDYTLFETLYPNLWIHAIIPEFDTGMVLFGIPLAFYNLETWIGINCIYYGDWADKPTDIPDMPGNPLGPVGDTTAPWDPTDWTRADREAYN
jgi:hypothetical protein